MCAIIRVNMCYTTRCEKELEVGDQKFETELRQVAPNVGHDLYTDVNSLVPGTGTRRGILLNLSRLFLACSACFLARR